MSKLRIIPLGGLGEIGMNCLVLEYGEEIIVVDCGLLFPDLEEFGIDFVVPNFSYLVERKEKIKAFVITHGHEDHIGALSYAHKAGVRAPVYATEFASKLIYSRILEKGLQSEIEIRTFNIGEKIKFKNFSFETVSVNHSIIEALALFIDTPLGKIVHTGDFKIDPEPYYGQTIDLNQFKKAGDAGVFLLLSDSTNVERLNVNPTEKSIFKNLEAEIRNTSGLSVVTLFASNVARMGQIYEIAAMLKKKVVLAGRSMTQNSRFAEEMGYLKHLKDVLIDETEIDSYNKNEIIVLASGSQGEFRSALKRISAGEHRYVSIGKNDRVLMSSRYIPGNELAINRVINELYRQGAEVVNEALEPIHVSGHATRPELKKMLELVRPKYFIPVHGEYRHLVLHAKLARETGVAGPNAMVVENGNIVECDPDKIEITDQIEDIGVYIDGTGAAISKAVLKQRRKLAESGVVVAAFTQELIEGRSKHLPKIQEAGVMDADVTSWMSDEAVAVIESCIARRKSQTHGNDLIEAVRIELRRFYSSNTGKKPVTIPLLLNKKLNN